MFNTRIYRQTGGCEMTFASGASLTFESGTKFNGTWNLGPGSGVMESGRLETYQVGASLHINHTAPSSNVLAFKAGTSIASFFIGMDTPTHNATPGSVYIRSQGSMSGLYTNISQDSSGSSWRGFQQGSAIG